ncbi:Pc21g08390 [Penicillium rubens Wisconsin 54-1255]|uniref:Solute carrier family 40 member n=1 Tax=Penicillium rubens (strain ATCC 28089 / DSM 1075 / NRRL 1951 / Wisconsin 54-1255) TaxID=500485 RepID=B6HLY1_PENRW|nr:Pc21g08390 [Penicillium rubens Wisconsin 54-1255]
MEFESSPAPSRRSSENVNNSSSALLPTADNASRPNDTPAPEARSVLTRLYISHTLSTWNSRMFEFGAVLFLASIFPGTLLYASIYALVRAFSAVALSSWLGAQVDHSDRLVAVRHSIVVWQRVPVAVSCLCFIVTLSTDSWALTIGLFAVQGLLACMEKLAATANTVAVERDWAIVISNSINVPRQDLNASMRRIDLFCKLLAPVFISLIDSISTRYAIWTVFTLNTASVLVEYMAIAQVYQSVPALTKTQAPTTQADDINNESDDAHHSASPKVLHSLSESLAPWKEYIASPVFLASLALSLLYLTVLSFGATMVTYLLSTGFTSLQVSYMRIGSVIAELSGTWTAPMIMNRIGPIRSGLWFLNWQFACVAAAAVPFVAWDSSSRFVAGTLIAGVALSRVGLWGFDLSVQFLVQENIQEHARARFSATEMALQNVFEMLSFASTIAFPLPAQFVYPVMISSGAVAVAAVCFAAYVRKERGHLLHRSRCMGGDKASYQAIGSGSGLNV